MNLFLSCTGRVSFRELNRSVTDPHSLHCPHPIGLCKVSCRAASETVIELRRLPARTRVPGGGGLWCMRSIAFWNCSADIALSMASIAGSGGGPRCPHRGRRRLRSERRGTSSRTVPRQEIPCSRPAGRAGLPHAPAQGHVRRRAADPQWCADHGALLRPEGPVPARPPHTRPGRPDSVRAHKPTIQGDIRPAHHGLLTIGDRDLPLVTSPLWAFVILSRKWPSQSALESAPVRMHPDVPQNGSSHRSCRLGFGSDVSRADQVTLTNRQPMGCGA